MFVESLVGQLKTCDAKRRRSRLALLYELCSQSRDARFFALHSSAIAVLAEIISSSVDDEDLANALATLANINTLAVKQEKLMEENVTAAITSLVKILHQNKVSATLKLSCETLENIFWSTTKAPAAALEAGADIPLQSLKMHQNREVQLAAGSTLSKMLQTSTQQVSIIGLLSVYFSRISFDGSLYSIQC